MNLKQLAIGVFKLYLEEFSRKAGYRLSVLQKGIAGQHFLARYRSILEFVADVEVEGDIGRLYEVKNVEQVIEEVVIIKETELMTRQYPPEILLAELATVPVTSVLLRIAEMVEESKEQSKELQARPAQLIEKAIEIGRKARDIKGALGYFSMN